MEKLRVFVADLVEQYVAVVGVRVASEPDVGHYGHLTTALDKFHRRLHAITQLLPNTDFGKYVRKICVGSKEREQIGLIICIRTFLSSLSYTKGNAFSLFFIVYMYKIYCGRK